MDHRDDTGGLVRRVVDLFAPDSFDVLAFSPAGEFADFTVPGYTVRRHVEQPVCGYGVTFVHFSLPATHARPAFEIDLH